MDYELTESKQWEQHLEFKILQDGISDRDL